MQRWLLLLDMCFIAGGEKMYLPSCPGPITYCRPLVFFAMKGAPVKGED